MPQTMRCILCYNNSIFITNAKTQVNKGLILYNIINGITSLKKHVFANHSNIAKMCEKVNNVIKDNWIKNLLKNT
jgi:hypothetical protein